MTAAVRPSSCGAGGPARPAQRAVTSRPALNHGIASRRHARRWRREEKVPCPVARGFDKGRSPDAPPGPWRRLTSHTIEGALARFHTDVTWTGTIQPGGMGLVRRR